MAKLPANSLTDDAVAWMDGRPHMHVPGLESPHSAWPLAWAHTHAVCVEVCFDWPYIFLDKYSCPPSSSNHGAAGLGLHSCWSHEDGAAPLAVAGRCCPLPKSSPRAAVADDRGACMLHGGSRRILLAVFAASVVARGQWRRRSLLANLLLLLAGTCPLEKAFTARQLASTARWYMLANLSAARFKYCLLQCCCLPATMLPTS
ncbi:hypothetical protein Dimus_010112 [Dionaea muscipula]